MNNEQELIQKLQEENQQSQEENKQLKLLLGEYALEVKTLSNNLDNVRKQYYGLYKEYVALKERYDNLNSLANGPAEEEDKNGK